ncbi:uncharacterized protein SOCEGT47_024380 [Sorangium cellulosum]|uniref:Cytochrome c domain-containing protein n=1 Tax=Sorangium cellulosum TaxID=56 RepID=A0A4P2PYS2_SORCE|nr:hypothetical protein [Sorangium cellulosum]AUX21940.1 uncharacterized protein SOCEGT47_024380 [Sorangium cellulosum]
MKTTSPLSLILAVGLGASLAACSGSRDDLSPLGAAEGEIRATNTGSYNLHLEETLRFNPVQPGADPARGRALFGLAADSDTEDKSQALFEGPSVAFGGTVVSNQRTCFTCHRGLVVELGLPAAPLSASIDAGDALFTGIQADAQGDPDALGNLDELALIKYRPNRFNPQRGEDDPFRRVFFWRKSTRLINVAFGIGFLNDARGRTMFETDRGAVFSHTQSSDRRFDDLFSVQDGNDLEAFQFSQLSDPRLAALRDPSDPMFRVLARDPFYTVPVATRAQERGKRVFEKYCMTCHNVPNVFSNLSNIEPLGNGETDVQNPVFGPSVGRTFNVGVSERNRHGLRFTHHAGGGRFEPIVLPLVDEDGAVVPFEVTMDVGLAATTGRLQDVGRFKVPQLRRLARNAPYFHDNSAMTIEEVVDHFNSDFYNRSRDGRRFPIRLDHRQRADLIEFLRIL